MDEVDCVVIGAGVVGLAVARALAQAGREVIVTERHLAFGSETSSRNSEVIHAGIYYSAGSLKALTCVRGRDLLYDYCAARGIPHKRLGKLIVARTEAEVPKLEGIAARAAANGVSDLRPLDGRAATTLEPALACAGALHSPSTGIVDSHSFMLALVGEIEDAGGMIAYGAALERGEIAGDGLVLHFAQPEPMSLKARLVVNAGGLAAAAIAGRIGGLASQHVPELVYAKGRYAAVTGRAPFERLIYPVPEDGGLGVHLTLDLAGSAKLGPDVTWYTAPDDYDLDDGFLDGFYASAKPWWPSLSRDDMFPGYAGMRPKLSHRGEAAADFRIDGAEVHGQPALVNMFGIESPGLTASLSLAEIVAARAAEQQG